MVQHLPSQYAQPRLRPDTRQQTTSVFQVPVHQGRAPLEERSEVLAQSIVQCPGGYLGRDDLCLVPILSQFESQTAPGFGVQVSKVDDGHRLVG